MERFAKGNGKIESYFIWIAIALFITVIGIKNFLLFHVLIELFSMIVGGTIFFFAVNTRKFSENGYIYFIGISYAFIALFDGLHMLSFKGMGVFDISDANISTQLWISGRLLESISLFVAPIFVLKKVQEKYVLIFLTTLTSVVIYLVFFTNHFPVCFIEGVGLTGFKKIMEVFVVVLLLFALYRLKSVKTELHEKAYNLVFYSIVFTTISEIFFANYITVNDSIIILGHLFKLFSFIFIYKAVIENGLMEPYLTMFRELKENEKKTLAINEELREALKEVNTLSGFLPICSACKKIRDDKGYWNRIEKYIEERSAASFSHGICPDCAKMLYPDLRIEE